MARLFRGGANNDAVEHADITSARFQQLNTWTIMAFFRIADTTGHHTLISKWAGSNTRQIVIRTDDGRSVLTPQNIRRARELGDAIVERHEPIRKAMSLADLATLVTDGLPTTHASSWDAGWPERC